MYDLVLLLYQSFGFDSPQYAYEIFVTTVVLFSLAITGLVEFIACLLSFGNSLRR